MSDHFGKEAYEKEKAQNYKSCSDGDDDGKDIEMENFRNGVILGVGSPEEASEFCEIKMNVDPSKPLSAGSIGAVVLGSSNSDPFQEIFQRLDLLERENNEMRMKLKMKVDGRLLVASLVEYVNHLQQVVIAQAGLDHFGCRFAAIFGNGTDDDKKKLKAVPLFNSVSRLMKYPFASVAMYRNTDAHPNIPFQDALLMAPSLQNACTAWRSLHQPRPVDAAEKTEEDLAWDLVLSVEGAIQRLEDIQASTEVKAILERDFPPPDDQNKKDQSE